MSKFTGRAVIRGVVPVAPLVLLGGSIWGLTLGFSSYFGLLNSEYAGNVDLASSKGIAAFVTVAIGVLIGTKLAMLTMKAFRLWTARLEARLVVCEHRISCFSGEAEPDNSSEEQQRGTSPLAVRFRYYSGFLSFGFGAVGVGLVMLLIKSGTTGLYGSDVHISLYSSLVIALVGIIAIASELMLIARGLLVIEQHLDHAEGGSITLLATRPKYADAAIQSTQSWLHRLTGVQGWQPRSVAR